MKRLNLLCQGLAVLITGFSVLLLFPANFASAQAISTGTVVGIVADQTGAVIPGADITLTDTSTRSSRKTVANATGQYVFVSVAPGVYTVSASRQGFSTIVIRNQTVSVGTQTTADFKMPIGAQTNTVEVDANNGSDLQTLNATVGSTVEPEAINSLPAIGRDVSTFATLQPGVTPGGAVAGTVSDQAVFQLDGGNVSDDMDGNQGYVGSSANNPTGVTSLGSGASGVIPMPADSIEEFKVNTAGQTADFNSSSGAQSMVVTKRGRDHWHGTAYEYYLDSSFGGNSWQNNLTKTAKPIYHYNRFGAAEGGRILPQLWGGRTYLFVNYEGFRYPNSATYERVVPSANMRNGIVSFNGNTYNMKAIDPRGIGVAPDVSYMWNTFEPIGNDASCGTLSGAYCDGVNELGYKANVQLPESSNFGVVRIDHDFTQKWRFNSSYRYFNQSQASNSQVDIGGFFSGDKSGVPVATASHPLAPWYFVAGLTTTVTTNTTNDFHYSFLRNDWSWVTNNAPAQVSGLGGAMEPFGESATNVLAPVNVNTSSIRQRTWDGHDNFLRDDVTMLKGNHLLQFGGQYEHNYYYFDRTDNGSGINYTTTYQLGDSNGSGLISLPGLTANGYPTGSGPARVASAVLGMVTDSQVAYTRSGSNLQLNPPLTLAQEQVTVPFYNVYFSDTWHMKPSFTFNYGLGWTMEMPPAEKHSLQVVAVDQSGEPIVAADYLQQRKAAAIQGDVYNPEVGFALTSNVGNGEKYPYNPFYGSFSPRISAAWSPSFSGDGVLHHIFGTSATVIRGGYGRVYGRLNGVGQVLVPLQGAGLIQPVQCRDALATGVCGSSAPNDTTAFRVGVDGTTAPLPPASATLPQPLYPGYNSVESATDSLLDPHFRPNDVDSFNLTYQRQINSKMLVEVGYIGRLIHHEFQSVNINSVPYMMSVGGQTFANAYAAIETAMGCATSAGQCAHTLALATAKNPVFPTVAPQPFFEAALAGTGYCNGYANCTTAVLNKEISNLGQQYVFNLWSDLDGGSAKTGGGFNFPRSMMGTPIPGQANGANGQVGSGIALMTANGHSNYNGGFVSFKVSNWHGLMVQENLTLSKALGTQAAAQSQSGATVFDPFNLDLDYGPQPFDQRVIFNTFMVYTPTWYAHQSGILGRVASGWTFSPILSAGSGSRMRCTTVSGSQSFGSADGANFSDSENCVFTTPYHGGHSAHYNVTGGADAYGNVVGTKVAGTGGAAVNMFQNPVAVYSQVRAPILGIDKRDGTPISGLPYWDMDISVRKNVKISERTSLEASGIITNIFNHNVFANPGFSIASGSVASFGVINSQGNASREIQMGIRANF
jgi:Carboxypeptidase regulatory-like domain